MTPPMSGPTTQARLDALWDAYDGLRDRHEGSIGHARLELDARTAIEAEAHTAADARWQDHRERCHNNDPDSVIAHLHSQHDAADAQITTLRVALEVLSDTAATAQAVEEWQAAGAEYFRALDGTRSTNNPDEHGGAVRDRSLDTRRVGPADGLDDALPKGSPDHRLVIEACMALVLARHEGRATYLASEAAELALAKALQSTILTSPDEYMGPGQGAYRTPYDDLTPPQQRHVNGDARAILAAMRAEASE